MENQFGPKNDQIPYFLNFHIFAREEESKLWMSILTQQCVVTISPVPYVFSL